MYREYYSLPLALDLVRQHRELARCSLTQSIIQHLHLLITTSFGEFAGDERFGCSIWENDFDNVTSAHKLKEIIRQSLLQSIQQQEQRIENVKVELAIFQEEFAFAEGTHRMKKRIDISIVAIVRMTNEKIQFRDSFFIGPISN